MASWYCPLPFRHAFVDSTGVAACCQTSRYPTTLAEWPDHPGLKQLQKELLLGNTPKACKGCVQQEQSQGRSLRTDAIQDYNNQVFTDTQITFVDYRSSNICNFKCRTCEPLFSNGIAQEARTHKSLAEFYRPTDNKVSQVTDVNSEWIITNLSKIKRLMFTGGEPTVIPEVGKILTHIQDNPPDNIQILITSNASFTDKFWYDLTESCTNLHWTLSIDAVGPAAEIIRHGTRWPIIEYNMDWMSRHSYSLDVNTVVSELNVFQLGPLLKFVRQAQLNSCAPIGRQGDLGLRHQFFVLNSAINWPDAERQLLINYLESCMQMDLDTEQHRMISSLITQLTVQQFDQSLWDRRRRLNTALDLIRSEQHEVLFQPAYT
jgi:sulfatase maturation enzyme AslB (radical SAM superfamily)